MSSVIKATAGSAAAAGTTYRLDDIDDRYLDYVREKAKQILAAAHAQAATIRQQASREGQQAALAAVDEVLADKVAAEISSIVPAIHKIAEELGHLKQTWRQHWERSAVRLATAIAERIIRREMQHRPEVTADLIREALDLAAGSPEIRLLLHPTDFVRLGDAVGALTDAAGRLAPVEVVVDTSVSPGGCRVETNFGVIDQTLEAQLKRIEQELT